MGQFFWIAALVLATIGFSILVLYVYGLVRWGLHRIYVAHAQRFCRKRGLEILNGRAGAAFGEYGTKTEFTLFDLECLDAQKQPQRIRLLIWIFGIRQVLGDEDE
jgi:hypothetical protein